MSQTPALRSLIVKYLAVFTALGLCTAVYLAATVSGLAATLVFIASLEAGLMLAGLAVRQQKGAVGDDVMLMVRSIDLGLRKLPRDVAE